MENATRTILSTATYSYWRGEKKKSLQCGTSSNIPTDGRQCACADLNRWIIADAARHKVNAMTRIETTRDKANDKALTRHSVVNNLIVCGGWTWFFSPTFSNHTEAEYPQSHQVLQLHDWCNLDKKRAGRFTNFFSCILLLQNIRVWWGYKNSVIEVQKATPPFTDERPTKSFKDF